MTSKCSLASSDPLFCSSPKKSHNLDDTRHRICKSIIHETLDGEAVVINLDNGRYYSMNESGSFIWNAIEAGYSLSEIAALCATGPETERASTLVSEFVAKLIEQGLAESLSAEQTNSATGPLPTLALSSAPLPFEAPTAEVFTDMERLIPLDPIHEVDERGWPNRRANSE